MLIQDLTKQFCEYSVYIKGYTSPTIQRYKQVINYYSKHTKVSLIEDVKEENLRNLFYEGRVSFNWTVNTFICYHKTLTVFFRWCINEGYLLSNPMDAIEIPKLEKRLPTKLTKQDASRLLEVVENMPYYRDNKFLRLRNHAIFATFIISGIRKKELLNLKYSDIDLENLSIFIRQGKGSKDRAIPINYKLAEILKAFRDERNKAGKTCPEFFTSLTYDAKLSEIGLKRLVDKVSEVSKIDFTIHKLRHTFATLMLEGGCDIYSLSKMMGHSDIKTTTIYLVASVEHLRAQIAKHPL